MKYKEFKTIIESCYVELFYTEADCGGEYTKSKILPVNISDDKLRTAWERIKKDLKKSHERIEK